MNNISLKLFRRLTMTQLIGAICENGKKVIVLSDRMITTSDLTLAFEHEVPKAEIIANNAIALTAGTIHEPEVIKSVREDFKGTHKPSIIDIARKLSEHFSNTRLFRIRDEILRRAGFNSLNEYYNSQGHLHDEVVLRLQRKIEEYRLDLHILLAGVDSRAHLYYICDPGTWRSFDPLGFCCIGQGDRHAEPVFAFYNYTPSLKEQEVLYIAFEAKKRSEMAGGIGKQTDVWIIDEGGVYEVENETIKQLEEIFEDRNTSTRRNRFDKRILEMEIKRRKVEIP